ncbi:hypothetical protein BGZ96_005963 [Linnemannia gamsii]|uniref:Uncharacterized protein n=1 Tax=Linnemannia gamsii TaxID=64522 RepID=A0ABQ7K5N6_9FUNG|nr:hypothetical protein BGZ96_005963 [Linnemannia gamsii]
MQNNHQTTIISNAKLNDSIDFLAKYGNSFLSYIRGQGSSVLLFNGIILLFIAVLVTLLDTHHYIPLWVTVCFALLVLSGAGVVTLFVYQYKKIKAMRIVGEAVSASLPTTGQDEVSVSIYVLPPQPIHVNTRR